MAAVPPTSSHRSNNTDEYIEIIGGSDFAQDTRTIRFDSGSFKTTSSRPSTNRARPSSSHGRRSSRYRPAGGGKVSLNTAYVGEDFGLIDELERRNSESKKRATKLTVNDDSTSSSSDEDQRKVYAYFKDSYEPFLKKSDRGHQTSRLGRLSSSRPNKPTSGRRIDDDDDAESGIDENEYDYIKNDGFDIETTVGGDVGVGSPSSLLLSNQPRRSKTSSSSRHYSNSSSHYRQNPNGASNGPGVGQSRRGIVLVSRDEIIPESLVVPPKRSRDDSPDAFVIGTQSRLSGDRAIEINGSRSRSADVTNRSYDRNYAAITRRHLFRNRFASRFRTLRSNDPLSTGDYRNQDFRSFNFLKPFNMR